MRDAKLNSVDEICISVVVLKNHCQCILWGRGSNDIITVLLHYFFIIQFDNLACNKAVVSSYKL